MKKFFKIVWKGLLGLAVASVALFGVVLGWAWYEDYTSDYIFQFLPRSNLNLIPSGGTHGQTFPYDA